MCESSGALVICGCCGLVYNSAVTIEPSGSNLTSLILSSCFSLHQCVCERERGGGGNRVGKRGGEVDFFSMDINWQPFVIRINVGI